MNNISLTNNNDSWSLQQETLLRHLVHGNCSPDWVLVAANCNKAVQKCIERSHQLGLSFGNLAPTLPKRSTSPLNTDKMQEAVKLCNYILNLEKGISPLVPITYITLENENQNPNSDINDYLIKVLLEKKIRS